LLEQDEDNTGAAEGKWESGALGGCSEEQGGGVVIRVRARNALNMTVI